MSDPSSAPTPNTSIQGHSTAEEVDPRPHWIGIVGAVALTVVAIVLVAIYLQPAATAGLVALVIAATAFPSIALWASRVSSIELVQSTARSAKTRNDLISIAITSLRSDLRASSEAQGRAIIAALASAQAATEEGTKAVVSELRALGETISRASVQEVQALEEARAATTRQEQVTRELAQLQVLAEQRARPQIHVQTQVRSAWLFFRHNWLMLANVGGSARSVVVNYRFNRQMNWIRLDPPFELAPQKSWEYDIGDVRQAGGSNELHLSIEVRDDANHIHESGEVLVGLNGNAWTPLLLRTRI